MKKFNHYALAFLCLASASFADYLDGSITQINRKSKGFGLVCNGYEGDHLVWIKAKGTVNGSTSLETWFVVGSDGEIGKQVLAMALSAQISSTPIRIDFNSASQPCGSNASEVEWIDELTLIP